MPSPFSQLRTDTVSFNKSAADLTLYQTQAKKAALFGTSTEDLKEKLANGDPLTKDEARTLAEENLDTRFAFYEVPYGTFNSQKEYDTFTRTGLDADTRFFLTAHKKRTTEVPEKEMMRDAYDFFKKYRLDPERKRTRSSPFSKSAGSYGEGDGIAAGIGGTLLGMLSSTVADRYKYDRELEPSAKNVLLPAAAGIAGGAGGGLLGGVLGTEVGEKLLGLPDITTVGTSGLGALLGSYLARSAVTGSLKRNGDPTSRIADFLTDKMKSGVPLTKYEAELAAELRYNEHEMDYDIYRDHYRFTPAQEKAYFAKLKAQDIKDYLNMHKRKGTTKSAADLRTVAEKWKDKAHLVAALKQHLQDAAGSLGTDNEEKELADIAIIAEAYRKGFVSPMMMAERMKKFRETAGLPPLASTPANLLPPVPSQVSPAIADDLATIDQLKSMVAATPQ